MNERISEVKLYFVFIVCGFLREDQRNLEKKSHKKIVKKGRNREEVQ